MTDAAPDQLSDETTPAPGDGPEFVVTPTLRAFTEIVERVEHLEASSPAINDDDEAEDARTQGRLDRHRAEIEAIKRTVNALIEYLTIPGANLPGAIPAAPAADPATVDPAGATP